MFKESPGAFRRPDLSTDYHIRTTIVLVALCCLTSGIAIGALLRGVASAKREDDRLEMSSSTATSDSLSLAFARAAQRVEPSVVHIKVVLGESGEGAASGVIVSPAGFIITNEHVVERATTVSVKLADGREFRARTVGHDRATDLAVIKIDAAGSLVAARMGDSDKLRVGDWVLAIGSPFGLEQTVTAGIISARDRDIDSRSSTPFQKFLQTDAAINPGNSGGPLVNLAGEVIGINTQIATGTGVYNGIGLAMPSATAVEVYNQLLTTGRVRRGFIGIRPSELTAEIAGQNKIEDNQGVVVEALTTESSPAAVAGIQPGDVITAINGEKVKTVRDMIRLIASLPVGSVAAIDLLREGQHRSARVKLEERQDDNPGGMRAVPAIPDIPRGADKNDDPKGKGRKSPSLGMSLRPLTSDIAKPRGLDGVRGLYVAGVEPGSPAADAGIRVDDVITEVNDRPIGSMNDFSRLTKGVQSGTEIQIKVLRRSRGLLRMAQIVSVAAQ